MKPKHYRHGIDPWDLQRSMHSSGDAFVDARRADVMKYVYRQKGDLLGDLKKARHCIEAAILQLEARRNR